MGTWPTNWYFCTTINLYNFKWSSLLAACSDDFDTRNCCENRWKDFGGSVSSRSPMSFDVSSGKTLIVWCHFLFKNGPLFIFFSHVIHFWFLNKWNSRKSNSKSPTFVFLRFLSYRVFQSKISRITFFAQSLKEKIHVTLCFTRLLLLLTAH